MQLLQQILHKHQSPPPNKDCLSPLHSHLAFYSPKPSPPHPKSIRARSHFHLSLNPTHKQKQESRTVGKREWFVTIYSKQSKSVSKPRPKPQEELEVHVSRLPIIRKQDCKRRILAQAFSQGTFSTLPPPQFPSRQFFQTHKTPQLPSTNDQLEISGWESTEPPWE